MNAHVNDNELQASLARGLADATSADVAAGVGLQAARHAAQSARRLGRVQDGLRASAWACIHLTRLGQHAQMQEEAQPLLPLLAAEQEPGLLLLRRELLRCLTLSGAETGAFDVALDAAHELAQASHASGCPEAALTAAYALAVCLERMGDSWQAVRTLNEALAGATGAEAPRELMVLANAVCAVSVGMAHRLRDTGADAERAEVLVNARQHGEMALSLLSQVSDVAYEAAVPGNLGEVRLLQGDIAAAWPLLDRALAHAHAQARGLKAHAWRVRTSMADWLLAAGRRPARAGVPGRAEPAARDGRCRPAADHHPRPRHRLPGGPCAGRCAAGAGSSGTGRAAGPPAHHGAAARPVAAVRHAF
jgi:tetratricopeptide (TPR) repeat protein